MISNYLEQSAECFVLCWWHNFRAVGKTGESDSNSIKYMTLTIPATASRDAVLC